MTPHQLNSLVDELNKIEEEVGLVKSQLVPLWLVNALDKKGGRKRRIDLRSANALDQLKLLLAGKK